MNKDEKRLLQRKRLMDNKVYQTMNDITRYMDRYYLDDRCSRQTIVTRCTLYQKYTTQEALEEAAKSYGGLTKTPFLSPR